MEEKGECRMRDILFKAKTCNGEWVQGLLAHKDNKWYISNKEGMPFAFEVRPETIGQYTGLKDKNDKKIFEGDLIILMDRWYCAVEYDVENARFILNGEYVKNEDEDEVTHSSFAPYYQNEIEVIGNIFDNPELLNYADNDASQQAHQEVLKSAT